MSDNTTPRATGEPVAWALCDDEGVFDVEQDEATAKEWVRGGADCGLLRWLRPLVFGDVAQPRPRVGVTEDALDAAWKELRVQGIPDGPTLVDSIDRDDLRSALTAAFTASERERVSRGVYRRGA